MSPGQAHRLVDRAPGATVRDIPDQAPASARSVVLVSSLLFVCAGNVCRSPFAERYAAVAAPGTSVVFGSAGFEALEGYGMDAAMAAELVARGGSASGFRARALDPAMMADADLVLTMTLRQRHLLRSGFPHYQDRVHTLGLAGRVAPQIGAVMGPAQLGEVMVERLDTLRSADDIPDPHLRGPAVASQVAALIAGHVDAVLEILG